MRRSCCEASATFSRTTAAVLSSWARRARSSITSSPRLVPTARHVSCTQAGCSTHLGDQSNEHGRNDRDREQPPGPLSPPARQPQPAPIHLTMMTKSARLATYHRPPRPTAGRGTCLVNVSLRDATAWTGANKGGERPRNHGYGDAVLIPGRVTSLPRVRWGQLGS